MSIPYKGETLLRTPIKCSNGAQNTVFMPEGAKATKVTLFSVVGTNSSNRTSYWKEVAGVNYDETTTTVLDLTKTNPDPNAVSFTLNNVPDKFTFTNTGEQQCVIIYVEYHFGGTSGIVDYKNDVAPVRVSYYTLGGRRVTTPERGLYIMQMQMPDGSVRSQKVLK